MTLVAVLAVLAAHNLAGNERWYVPVNLATAGVVTGLALSAGASPHEIGLTANGAATGLACGVAAGCVVALAAVLPVTRPLFRDERMRGVDGGATARLALIRIPLGTVVLEEVAFRGVLPVFIAPWAAAVLFGLWHVRPAAQTLATNNLSLWLTAAAVAATTLAGLGFHALKQASGGLLAPAIVHASITSTATVAAFLAHRRR